MQALLALQQGKVSRLREALRLNRLSPADRALALELALGSERQHLSLDHLLSRFVDKRLPRDPLLLVTLRLGAYQLLYLDKIPAHAAVFETVALLRSKKAFANAVLRRMAGAIQDRPMAADAWHKEWPLADGKRCLLVPGGLLPAPDSLQGLALAYGLPEFLVETWQQEFGQQATLQACKGSSRTPVVVLRPSAKVKDATDLQEQLATAGVQTELLCNDSLLRCTGGTSPFSTACFDQGLFVAQDPTAFAAVRAMAAQPGETVLDLCAAPGTKATDLAAQVGSAGKVLAYDIDVERRQEICDNAERLGLPQLQVCSELPQVQADRVLVDAPCSNSGVLARRVEVRRRIHPAAIQHLAQQQLALLRQGLALCRPGGFLLYSTCSIERQENQEVVAQVLGPQVRLQSEKLTLPSASVPCDGGYYAVLSLLPR